MKKLLLAILSFTCTLVAAQNSITWTMSSNIAAGSYGNLHPRIVTNAGGNPVVIWGRMSDKSVFISRWNGTAFTMPMKVNPTWLSIATLSWMGPDIAAKGDTIYVVMKRVPEMYDTNYIYIARSFDGGMTFSAPVRVDNIADSVSRFPVVTTDNAGNPIVGFMKFNSSFLEARWAVTRSNDFGNTFSTDVEASGWSGGNGDVCDCCPGAVLSSGNTIAMLYRDNLSNIRDIWAGVSSDGGNTFSGGMGIDQGNWQLFACPSSGPDGIIKGDTLYSTYMSGAGGTNLVYLSKSSLSAMTGSAGTALTGMIPGLSLQNYPRIANAGNALTVVWKQNVNGADQLAMRFTNNIANGLPAAYDTVDLDYITNADVALTDGNIFVVWQDDNSGTVKYRAGTFMSTTGIDENIQQGIFSVYPNPSSDLLNINLSSVTEAKVSITDILGQQVFSEQTSNSPDIKVNISEWNNGIYFVSLHSKQINSTQKIMVHH